MTATDGPPNEIAYARGEPDTWETACRGFQVTAEADQQGGSTAPTLISGTCPRCGHDISKSLVAQADVVAFSATARAGGPAFLVTCNCVGIHPDRPEGVYGCGAQGGVRLTQHGPDWVPVYVRLGVEEREADESAEAARRERLPRLRTFAQQWATAFGAIAGLVTFGAVLDADDAVRALRVPWSYVYVLCGGLALLFAALTVLYASRAAGLKMSSSLAADVPARLMHRDALIESTAGWLRGSYWWAALAVVFFAVSMGIRYFAPVVI
jgi:hypothetical protein